MERDSAIGVVGTGDLPCCQAHPYGLPRRRSLFINVDWRAAVVAAVAYIFRGPALPEPAPADAAFRLVVFAWLVVGGGLEAGRIPLYSRPTRPDQSTSKARVVGEGPERVCLLQLVCVVCQLPEEML